MGAKKTFLTGLRGEWGKTKMAKLLYYKKIIFVIILAEQIGFGATIVYLLY